MSRVPLLSSSSRLLQVLCMASAPVVLALLAGPIACGSDASAGPVGGAGGQSDAGDDVSQLEGGAGVDSSWPDAHHPDATDGFVDSGGEDAGLPEGLHAGPQGTGDACSPTSWCALSTARDKVRAMIPAMTGDLVVYLHGGTYELESTFELGPEDSGTGGYKVVYRAFPGEVPVLSGGVSIPGWVLEDAAKGLYRASVPAGLRTRQVYVDGVRGQRARGPLTPSGWTETADGYTVTDPVFAGLATPQTVEVVDLTFWKSFRCGVSAVQGSSVVMDQPCWELAQLHQGFDMGPPDWIENALELTDAPGEWFHDEDGAVLYYVPRAGEDLATASVVAASLETLVRIAGPIDDPAHDIELRGLTFSHATWLGPSAESGYPALQAGYHWTGTAASPSTERIPGNVVLDRAEDIAVRDCEFSHLGAYALVLSYGCKNNVVEGNAFRDISAGAVQVGDVHRPKTTDPREVASNNRVANNFVTGTGREYHDAVGIFAGYTDGTILAHNELHGLSYSGISVGWGWSTDSTVAKSNRVEGNLVAYVMQRLADGGMTYTLSAQPDSWIRDNYFHSQIHDFGGIYLDQGSMYFTVSGNVVASAPYWFLLQPTVAPAAQQNVVRHNFTDTASEFCCGGLGCCTDVNTIEDNAVFAPGAFPAEARAIAHGAGLQARYRRLRDDVVRIEAEDYSQGGAGVAWNDLTPGNAGGAHRNDDVDVYPCARCSNDATLGYTQTGEWLSYYIDAPYAAVYELQFAVGTQDPDCRIAVTIDGNDAGAASLPNTGGWNESGTAWLAPVVLNPGPHRLVLKFTGGFNFDYFELTHRREPCDVAAGTSPDTTLTGEFDGNAGVDELSIYQQAKCWSVRPNAGTSTAWLYGWDGTGRSHVGDYDGDGRDDVLLIVQASLTWNLALSRGDGFTPLGAALTGWGAGTVDLVGDFDGDGRDDVTVIYLDGATQQWRWQLARSLGFAFEQVPGAHAGTDPGQSACVADVDGDQAEEIVIPGAGGSQCADYDTATKKFFVAACTQVCP